MERKIGEIFEYKGEWYQCVEQPKKLDDTACKLCAMAQFKNCELDECSGQYRTDRKSVIFKKLEKTWKQVRLNEKEAQLIKAVIPCCISCAFFDGKNCEFLKKGITPGCENGAYIEIKQNQEDMEEKKLPKEDNLLTRTVHKYVNGEISDKELIKAIKGISDEYPYDKNALKPFSIESAKAGKPVCTRNGRKARIICFDAKFPQTGNIVALVEKKNGEEITLYYYDDGHCSIGNDYDLMMLPEKHEGWVNIIGGPGCDRAVLGRIYKSREEAVESAQNNDMCVATVKISWEE